MEVVLSPMHREHIRAVIALEKECGLSPRSEESYLKLLQNSYSILLVALNEASADSVIAAFSGWVVAGEFNIDNIAVKESYRQKGIASALLAKAIDEARKQGAITAFLEVRASNDGACSLYEKAGFSVVGRRTGYYHNPSEDALMMSLDLLSRPGI